MDFRLYKLTHKAVKDVDSILDYVSNQLSNPIAAQNINHKIIKAINQICCFPESCPIVINDYVKNDEIR